MTYFDDIEFLAGAIAPSCTVTLRNHTAACYSREFISAGRLHLERAHDPPVILDQPAVFWHRPQGVYDYGASDARGWDHHWVTFRGDRARRLIEIGLDQLSETGYFLVHDPIPLRHKFGRLIGLIHQRIPSHKRRAVCLMEELLMMIMDNQLRPTADEACRVAMEGLCRAIELQPWREPDFSEEARRLNMSYSHFRRRFKEFVGRAPHDYVLTSRMYYAARQLMRRDLSVKQIAADVGYDDQGQFSRMFKRAMGLSPSNIVKECPVIQSLKLYHLGQSLMHKR